MADNPVINLGENSREYIAYRLMNDVLNAEFKVQNTARTRESILNTYAECLYAVGGFRDWTKK